MLTSRARAIRRTVLIPGLRTPRSIPLTNVWSRSAFSASLSWENPRSARIRATLRPKARRVQSLFFIGRIMRPMVPARLWPIGYNVLNWNVKEVEPESEEDSVTIWYD